MGVGRWGEKGGGESDCKFPKLCSSYLQSYSQNFPEKSILGILTLPKRDFSINFH